MSSFGSGFASGMGQGMAMGKMLMDTYNDYDQKDKLNKASELNPEEVKSYDADTQARIQTLRDQKNADGTSLYTVEDVQGGGVRYKGAGDQDWTNIDQNKSQWKLGNKTYDVRPTDDQIGRARHEAIADVYAKNGDPAKALGFRAAAREDRKGSELERIGDEERSFLTDMASNGGQVSDNAKSVLTKAAGIYNQNQGKHNDGLNLTYDWDKGEAIFTKVADGTIARREPINGKTATFVGSEYFNHQRAALDPKFGLDLRNVQSGERKADAEVTKSDAYAKLIPSEISKNNAMAGHYANGAGSGGSNGFKMTTANITDDSGVTTKVPFAVTMTKKNGVPTLQAYTVDGKPVTDSKVLAQIAGGEANDNSTTGRNADLAAARKKYENGGIDYAGYKQETQRIHQDYDRSDAMSKLGNDFKTVEKKEGRDSAVRSVVSQVEGSVNNPKDRAVVYGQLGIKNDEVLRAKRERKGGTGLDAATNYSTQSTWQPNQRRIPENMRGQ